MNWLREAISNSLNRLRANVALLAVIFDGLLFIATCAYVVVSHGQLHAMKKTLGQVKTQTSLTKQGLEQTQKAFVYVSNVSISPTTMPPTLDALRNSESFVILDVTNSGNTPARAVNMTINCYFSVLTKDFKFPDFIKNPININPIFFAPRQDRVLSVPIPTHGALSTREGLNPLTVYGHIEYRDDVFSRHHRTWFCYQYAAGQLVEPYNKDTKFIDIFYSCPQHNCSDDDCPEPKGWKPPLEEPYLIPSPFRIPQYMLSPQPSPAPSSANGLPSPVITLPPDS